ncbi:MAG TPA: mechanosensitive ion channel family protein [Candidatus Acidoferrales bacterium]|nr:mechanosensitive ion channel family protein [Candidatus Acidoferrales bacterium]
MANLLPHWTDLIVARSFRLLVIVVLAFLASRLLRGFTNRLVVRATSDSSSRPSRMRDQQTRTVAGILNSAGLGIIFVIAALMAMHEFNFDIGPIVGAAGLASLGIGIGAQGLVRDVINGFFVVFEDQYVVGDQIKVGDTLGRVEHLTLRRTVLRTPQGAIVTIPNGQIMQVANLSRDWSQLFLAINVAAEADLDRALSALDQVAAEFRADDVWKAALVDGPRALGVDSFGPAGAALLIQVRTAPLRQDDVARELRRRIRGRFEKESIPVAAEQKLFLRYEGNAPQPGVEPVPAGTQSGGIA